MQDTKLYSLYKITGILVFALFIVWIVFKHNFGTTTPGSFFETWKDYKEVIYINVFTDREGSKNYRVPGVIYQYSNEGASFYSLSEFYWPNGGYSEFHDNCFPELNKRVLCTTYSDDKETDYYIEITPEKVPDPLRNLYL